MEERLVDARIRVWRHAQRAILAGGDDGRRTGKRQEAQEALTTATTMYREMGMGYWLEQAEADREP